MDCSLQEFSYNECNLSQLFHHSIFVISYNQIEQENSWDILSKFKVLDESKNHISGDSITAQANLSGTPVKSQKISSTFQVNNWFKAKDIFLLN